MVNRQTAPYFSGFVEERPPVALLRVKYTVYVHYYMRIQQAKHSPREHSHLKYEVEWKGSMGWIPSVSKLSFFHRRPLWLYLQLFQIGVKPVLSTLFYSELSGHTKGFVEQTYYEQSPEYIQRQTINHAAIWITVGFVAILLTYILALFIHEKGR